MLTFIEKASPNYFTPDEMTFSKIVAVVAHGTDSIGIAPAVDWLTNPKSGVSSNFAIAKSGQIYQLVDFRTGKRAWANGVIDKVNYDKSLTWLNSCVKNRVNPNWVTVSIEHEATHEDMLKSRPMTDAQFNSSVELTAYIMRIAGLKATHESYVTHHQIAGIMKPYCPGVINPGAFTEVLIARNPDLKP